MKREEKNTDYLWLPLLAAIVLFCCCRETEAGMDLNKDNILVRVEEEREEVLDKLGVCLDFENRKYKTPANALLLQLGRFQDRRDLNILQKIAQDDPYELTNYIYGLYRQGQKGKEYLSLLRQQDLNLSFDEREKQYKTIIVEQTNDILTKIKLCDAISEHLKYANEIDLQTVDINEQEILRMFIYAYTGAYVGDIWDKIFEEDKNFDVSQKKYLGENTYEWNNAMMRFPFRTTSYPGSIFDNASFSSALRILCAENNDRRFIAALIMSYWGLDIGGSIIIKEIKMAPDNMLKCAAGITALRYIRLGKNNSAIAKELCKLLENKKYNIYRELILHAIIQLRTDVGDSIFTDKYILYSDNANLIDKFASYCGEAVEGFWMNLCEKTPSLNNDIAGGGKIDISRLLDDRSGALRRIRTLKFHNKNSPELADLFRTYCVGYDSTIVGIFDPSDSIQRIINSVTIPENELRQQLEEGPLGLMISTETYKNYKASEIINILRAVAEDNTPKGAKIILFSTQVNPNNSPISPTNSFTPNTERIYVCFKNETILNKTDRLIIKWTNLSTKSIIYWSFFIINPNDDYNYFFLGKKREGWEIGKYLITIYKQIQDISPVGYGEFEIK